MTRAGWSEVNSDEWYDDEALGEESPRVAEVTAELERSGFHVLVSWTPAQQELVVLDPTDGRDWTTGSLPPLFPLDTELALDLSGESSQAARAETVRRAFAAAGLLDTTRIRVPDPSSSLRADLVLLLMADHLYDVAERHRGRDDAGEVLALLGEDASWRLASGMRAYPLIVPAPVPSAAARGIAEWCWRRETEVEDWHHKVDDLTMARANIAATRAVLPHVHLEGVDWPAVRLALTLPRRRLADGRALTDLFEEGWPPILASIRTQIDLWQRLDDELGPQAALILLSLHGSRTESVGDWWGSGHYETLTRRAIHNAARQGTLPEAVAETFADATHFADVTVHSPDTLDDDTLRWLTHAILTERSTLRARGEPDTTAVTLSDWAVEQLTDLLSTDHDTAANDTSA
ncbi:hypothetical protein ALI22I_19895 [Saccharothrix sp. ALI-22-I]|nr:hypothetical protein ALI22I_19895 [Saccharothrix sp. ALI-22-I]